MDGQQTAAFWKMQIELCEAEYHTWHERCKKISRIYRDERSTTDADTSKRTLNLFWSNVQILKPAIYSKTPVPVCERRFLDKDTTGRVASTILERTLRYEMPMGNFHAACKKAVLDHLLTGRGQVWVRYNPKFGEAISPSVKANDEMIADGGEVLEEDREKSEDNIQREVESESLCVDYTHWQDYYQFPAGVRTEEEIQGKGRRIYFSREDCIEKFGKKIGRKIELDHVPQAVPDSGSKAIASNKDAAQATIYEIWWKPTKKVIFIAKSYDGVCMEVDDPLHLEGFFPCPPALQATTTNDTMIPVPDYAEAQDQYTTIDILTRRIDVLTGACKVVGVFDASAQGVKRVFEEASEPNLIPVDSWTMFAEKGGIAGALQLVPLKDISDTLTKLIEVRGQIMQDLDHVTGISDINRGTSDARETMGGVKIKQNNISGRLQERKDEVARFCRDIVSIMGEIVSEHFDEKTLIEVSGALYDDGLIAPPPEPTQSVAQPPMMGHNGGPPMEASQPPQQAGAFSPPGMPPQAPDPLQQKLMVIQGAIDLLRNDKLRGFRIDIETDSTVETSGEDDKAAVTEFITEVTKFIETSAKVVPMVPAFAPLASKMLQFAVRRFRVGRDLEASIEEFGDEVEMQAKKAASMSPKPTPEDIKAQSDREKGQADIAAAQFKSQTDQMQAQAEIERQRIENEGEQRNAQIDFQSKQLDKEIKLIELEITKIRAQADIAKTHQDHQTSQMTAEHERLKMKHDTMSSEMDLASKAGDVHQKLFEQNTEPMKEFMAGMIEHLQSLKQKDSEPIEFHRGNDGKLTHVKKGDRVMKIHRGADGKAAKVN